MYDISIKVIPIAWFSDAPAGPSDPDFVLDTFVGEDMWTIEMSETAATSNGLLDGDIDNNEEADDDQEANVYDSTGTLVANGVQFYIEWEATYTSPSGDTLTMWRIETETTPQIRMFAVSSIPELDVVYTTSDKDTDTDDLDPDEFEDAVVCFCAGTMIRTDAGDVPVEDLVAGMNIETLNGFAELKWIGQRKISSKALEENSKLRPIRIGAGALGDNLPVRDLLVSRQHRMLVRSQIAKRMFGVDDVLVAAFRLTELPGVEELLPAQPVTYFHLLFDKHEVVFAENAPSESLFLGPQTMKTLDPSASAEVLALFPDALTTASSIEAAAFVPDANKQRKLVDRHQRNGKQALETLSG